jgi:hypothetical protein
VARETCSVIHEFRVELRKQRLDRASVAAVLDRLPLRRDEDCDRIAGMALIAMKENNAIEMRARGCSSNLPSK